MGDMADVFTPCRRGGMTGYMHTLHKAGEPSRDEFIVSLLSAGVIQVDVTRGSIYVTRGPGGQRLDQPRLVTGSNCNGYRVATLCLDGCRKQIRLHRLIWIAAHGLPEAGLVVCHRNNDKTDNRIENLYLATSAQNSTDASVDGLYRSGGSNPSSKIGPETAAQIVSDYRNGYGTTRRLAARYGISKSRIHQIIHESRRIKHAHEYSGKA